MKVGPYPGLLVGEIDRRNYAHIRLNELKERRSLRAVVDLVAPRYRKSTSRRGRNVETGYQSRTV